MPTYSAPPSDVSDMADEIIDLHHQRLSEAGVSIDFLFAHATRDKNGDPTGQALKHRGLACAGLCKIVPYKLRVQGHSDAEIILDGDRWDEWSNDQKRALLDHEITHIELCFDGEGNLKRDDLDRPKLRLRPHDYDFGWFADVAERHGQHAFEIDQLNRFMKSETFTQRFLPFMEEPLEHAA